MTDERSPRRILLAVTGLIPQVITETLYALAVQRQPAFISTDIHRLTTHEGAEAARLGLLSDEPGWFYRLCADYALPAIRFDVSHIHTLTDAHGQPLSDIRTPDDNQRAADTITELVRHFTADPTAALHVSIAGGRKTMGYYLGYALSLFGRPQDHLSHVLVSEPFEGCPDFYYPTPYNRVIVLRDNKLADTRDAQVTLAEIPFVRLRDELNNRLLTGAASFGQTVATAQRALLPPELVIDLAHRRLTAAGELVELPPVDLAFYSFMARRQCQGKGFVRRGAEGLDQAFLAEYRQIVSDYVHRATSCWRRLNPSSSSCSRGARVWRRRRASRWPTACKPPMTVSAGLNRAWTAGSGRSRNKIAASNLRPCARGAKPNTVQWACENRCQRSG